MMATRQGEGKLNSHLLDSTSKLTLCYILPIQREVGEYTGYSLEYLPGVMENRDGW